MFVKKPFDFWIFAIVVILVLIGIIMVMSSSMAYNTRDFFQNQIRYGIAGIIIMLLISFINYKLFGKLSILILISSIALLVLVLIPGIGSEINNSRRWLYGFQPSEIAKLAIIIFFSYSLSKRNGSINKITGLIPYFLILLTIVGLLILEPHKSGAIIIMIIGVSVLLIAGAKIRHFIIFAIPVVPVLVFIIMKSEYAMQRIITYLNPAKADPLGSGYQILNSLYAIASGGVFGRGIGRSAQKYFYIPEAHNDFIFSIIAEETGFIGVVVIFTLFSILIMRGLIVSMKAPDSFGRYLSAGVTCLIALQTVLNIGVVTALLPATGVSLPFLSYGGSSLLIMLFSTGILLSVSRQSNTQTVGSEKA